MIRFTFSQCMIASTLAFAVAAVHAQTIAGKIGSASGSSWQSSWLDLTTPTSFRKGDKLVVTVEGTAENVLVRLLPAKDKERPDSPIGIEGRARKVPADKKLEVTLERDHPDVGQVSVHGGASAWSTPLGAKNGSVTIVSISKVTK